jgi:hypothetical protein
MKQWIMAAALTLAACGDAQQEAREDAAAKEDAVVAQQTGQDYGGEGPREQAAERLGEAYSPSVEAVANSENTPVQADLPAEVPAAGEASKGQ